MATSQPSRMGWLRVLLGIFVAAIMAAGPILAGFHEEPNMLQLIASIVTVVVAGGVATQLPSKK